MFFNSNDINVIDSWLIDRQTAVRTVRKVRKNKKVDKVFCEKTHDIRTGTFGVQIKFIDSSNLAMGMIHESATEKKNTFDWLAVKRTSLKNPDVYFFKVSDIDESIKNFVPNRVWNTNSIIKNRIIEIQKMPFVVLPRFSVKMKTNGDIDSLLGELIKNS